MAANPESFPLLSSGRPTLVAENVEQLLSDPYSVRVHRHHPRPAAPVPARNFPAHHLPRNRVFPVVEGRGSRGEPLYMTYRDGPPGGLQIGGELFPDGAFSQVEGDLGGPHQVFC